MSWRPLLSPGETFPDTLTDPPELPAWLGTKELDRNWEQGAFLSGLALRQPGLFIGGADDPAFPLEFLAGL